MNIKASYQYQLMDNKKAIYIYYFIFISLFLFILLSMSITVMNDDGTTSSNYTGMDMATAIFIFVTGLCSFKDVFGMMMQNGISRKTLFIGRQLTALTISLGMAAIDLILLSLCKVLASVADTNLLVNSIYDQLYFNKAASMSNLQLHTTNYLFHFFLYLAFISAGYLITLVFYRLNKAGKVAIGAGVPAGIFIVLPIFDLAVTRGKITKALGEFIDFAFGFSTEQPMHAIITCLLSFIVFSSLSWLLIRKASIK